MSELIESYRFGDFCSKLLLSPLSQLGQLLRESDFVVADPRTAGLLPSRPDFLLEPGEQNKTLAQLERLLGAFAERRLVRSSRVLAFGGGLLCDLTGFAAATYMRGCALILVPTTLLSMVDAGLGGKTGCNFQNYKNMIGSFYPAGEVHIVPEVLATLPPREFLSGLAELCKHALLSENESLWRQLQVRKGELKAPSSAGDRLAAQAAAAGLRELLIEGVRVKGRIVARDLYERGERAFLNLGHTYAHALEKVSSFACSHGEAVAWGLRQALQLSAELGYCSHDYTAQVQELLSRLGFALKELDWYRAYILQNGPDSLAGELLAAMGQDKKRRQSDGQLRLVLQRGRGQTVIRELAAETVLKSMLKDF